MESLLTFAEELERRDAEVAQSLDRVELVQARVEELRARAAETAAFLAELPQALAERAADERTAAERRERAQSALREAEQALERAAKEEQRLLAERAVQAARDDLHAAEFWVEQTRAAHEELEREGETRRTEAEQLVERAGELAATVRDVPAGSPNLDGVVEWASRARGALLLEHSKLVGERDEIVREATELLASVSGDPLTSIAVAGVRERLARALAGSSS
jgi:chromosome segregation protein